MAKPANRKLRIRPLQASEVTFTVSVEPDSTPVRGNAQASGDEDDDREVENAILARLARGDTAAWCGVIVTAQWGSFVASDSVWCVSMAPADDPEKWAKDYGLHAEALARLNRKLDGLAQVVAQRVVRRG